MRYPEKLIEGGEGFALDASKPPPAEMLSVCRIAYRLFIDTHTDSWKTKLMPRMRSRMRYWRLTST